MTFFSSQSRRVILNKKHFSLLTGVFSPHLFPALGHFGFLLLWKTKWRQFLCVCTLIDNKFRHKIVKVYCGTTQLRHVVPQPLLQCYDAIYHQKEDRREWEAKHTGPLCLRQGSWPIYTPLFPNLQVSTTGLVPRKHSIKFRSIFHLSFPKSGVTSINYSISKEDHSW